MWAVKTRSGARAGVTPFRVHPFEGPRRSAMLTCQGVQPHVGATASARGEIGSVRQSKTGSRYQVLARTEERNNETTAQVRMSAGCASVVRRAQRQPGSTRDT